MSRVPAHYIVVKGPQSVWRGAGGGLAGGWYRPLFFYRWLVGTKQSKQNLRQSAEFAAVCRIFPRPESQNSIESQKLAVPTVLQKWFMARSLLQCGLGFI